MRIRTGYSFKFAVGHLEEVAKRIAELQWEKAPISDRNSTFGFNRWTKLCKKLNMKPVYGVEIGIVKELGEKKPTPDYWTFFAIDSISAVNELVALATANSSKEPLLTYNQALAVVGVVRIMGERTDLESVAFDLPAHTYLALSPSTSMQAYNSAVELGIPLLLTPDNVYTNKGDTEFYRVALDRRANVQIHSQHITSDYEIAENINWFVPNAAIIKARDNRAQMLALCKAELRKAEMLVPERPQTLLAMCIDGAKRLGVDLEDPVYKARLERELALIKEKNFEDYFYIIVDMIAWAKQRMIVGPARGSSCGSLVCYLTDITTIDPIKYDLIFERFIDINRTDLPDIDIDFSDTRREQVFQYMEQKYGEERVARLGTVGMFKPRSALKASAIALNIPEFRIDKLLSSIVQRSSGDARALQAIEDTLKDTAIGREMIDDYPEIKIAGRLEGHPANASQHAAGIVVTQYPVKEYIAVDSRTRSAMCDKKDAEDLEALKIDALGLTQLSIFERTLELIGVPSVSGWLEKLPTDDQAAFDVLNKKHFAGVFQFAGGALQSLIKQVKRIDHIEDIISITALARPGPMATGGAGAWVRRRTGQEVVQYPHPLFEPTLRGTLGVVMYQEQVMQIGREIGDLSWGDVTALRKAMSKSLGKEFFDQFGDRWKAAAEKKGIERHVLDKVWDDLCAYGSWAFNRSHAVAYGIVSYWCCWLKAHHPVEFAAATLDAESEPSKQIKLLREIADEGIDYVPFDPEVSTDRWVIATRGDKKILVGPLTSVSGIGPAAVNEIISARKRGQPIRPALMKKMTGAKTEIDTLFPVRAAVKRLVPNLAAIGIVSEPVPIVQVQTDWQGDVMIIGVVRKIAPKDENEEVNVAKRGYKLDGPTRAINLFFYDDTDEIFCKVSRFDFARLQAEVLEKGRVGKSIYAVKGKVNPHFRMISVKQIRYLGEFK